MANLDLLSDFYLSMDPNTEKRWGGKTAEEILEQVAKVYSTFAHDDELPVSHYHNIPQYLVGLLTRNAAIAGAAWRRNTFSK